MKKYIEATLTLYKEDETKVSQEELDQFIDDFLELVESKGYFCAGGWQLKTEEEL